MQKLICSLGLFESFEMGLRPKSSVLTTEILFCLLILGIPLALELGAWKSVRLGEDKT